MNKVVKHFTHIYFLSSVLAFVGVLLFRYKIYAAIDALTLQASNTVGVIENISQAYKWTFNLFRYLGWAGVIVGVGLAIFTLIYKLFSGDSEEAMKQVQSYLTKAVIIVVAGILLISAGFIVNQVGALLGVSEPLTVEEIGSAGVGALGGPPVGGYGTCSAALGPGGVCSFMVGGVHCTGGAHAEASPPSCSCVCKL